jgi:peptide/nickel transport system permease protein
MDADGALNLSNEKTVAVLLHPLGQRGVFRRLIKDKSALFGLTVVVILVSAALFAPLIAPHDPAQQYTEQRFSPPTIDFPLGTDNLGRCLLSRLIFGARVSLATAAVAASLIVVIGVFLGILAGYFGGWLDFLIMRTADLILAFPLLLLALAIAGFVGIGIVSIVIGIVSVWWASYSRIVRGLVLSLREQPFIEAARASGTKPRRIITHHLLPNVISPIVVLASLEIGNLILAVSALNFLGLGVQSPTPEWGAILNDGRLFLQSQPQLMIYPGLLISLSVLGFNLLGDSLRDALDPRLTD